MSGKPNYRFVALRREGLAFHLTFDRPIRRNALNHAMMLEIGDAVDRVGADRSARALVLRGTGGAFCAGGDLGAMSELPRKPRAGPDPLVANYRSFGDVLARLNRLPQAVVSVVEGPAVCGLDRALESVLRYIGRMEPDALATVKRLTMMCSNNSDEAVMDRASVELVRLLRRPEALAGMQAFLQKNLPPWAAG